MSDAFNESPIGNSSSDHNLIDTDLQVRLMNLVMGEASDFERDQLQLLMEQRPELAAYCKHLEHLHGFLSEVGAGEPASNVDAATEDTEWRLCADRRERVLSVLENRISNPPPKVTLANKRSFRNWRITTMEAIVVASIACVILGLMLPTTQSAREAARRFDLRGGTDLSYLTSDMVPSSAPVKRESVGKSLNAILSVTDSAAPSAVTTDLYSHPGISPHYLSDDVQYFPASPETKMAFDPQVSGTLESLAEQKRGRTYGEKQLGESNFGRPVVDGEDQMARRSTTAAVASEVNAPSLLGGATSVATSPNNSSTVDNRYVQPPVPSPNFSDIAAQNTIGNTSPNIAVGQSGGVAGAAAPAFTTDLDFQIRNNFGVKPAFGAPDSGAADVSNMPDSAFSTFLAHRDPQDNIGSKEGKVASSDQSLPSAFGNEFLREKNEAKKAAIAPAKPNLNSDVGLWAKDFDSDGALDAVEARVEVPLLKPHEVPSTAIIPPVIDQDVKSYTVNVPEDGTILLGGIKRNRETKSEKTTLNRLFKNDASDTNTLMMTVTPRIIIPEEDEEALGVQLNPSLPSGDQLSVANPTEGWQELSARQLDRYGTIDLERETKTDNTEVTDLFSATIPNDLNADWSRRFRLEAQHPAIINEEATRHAENEIKARQGQDNSSWALSGKALSQLDSVRLAEIQPGSSQVDRLNPNGTKEIVMDIAEGGITLQQNTDYVAAGRINISPTPGEIKNEEMRNWKSKTAPSPELAKNGRDGANAEGKPVAPKQLVTVDEQSASAEAFSTFSLHVSDVSFKLAQAALSQSQWPEAAKIRIEEFVNALDYHDPLPSGEQKIACRVEQAIHPFLMQRNLLRVSMRTAAAGRSQNTPLRLTLLLDNSGSMERPDRRQAVLRAFQTLSQQLKSTDQITLISFASSPRLLADKVPGNQGETLLKLIETLPSEGGTNIESALQLAREKAAEQQVAGAQNRIVLLTDGAVNLGDANPENLAKQVTQMRDAGIAFDAAGISAQDLNDEVLEALTRQGDGRYYLLDSAEAASDSFAAQIAGSLRPSAQNVKVQVEFNPQRVGRYKLLGYEKHRLNKEDFRNDQVDAAEMAAAEAGVAVYHYEIKPKGSGDVGSVSVRFRDLSTRQMVERRWPILYESNTPRLEQSQPSMQLAAAAALFAAKLGGGPLADSVDLAQLQKLVAKLPEHFASQPRVQQLRAMIEQAIAIH